MFEPGDPQSWVFYADNSYIVSRLLWFTGCSMEAPVSAHRTVELFLKAYLVSKGEVVGKDQRAWGHVLTTLLGLCAEHDAAFSLDVLARRVRFFQRYFDLVRYPTLLEGKLRDGSLIWFGADSSIVPLDEIVAFIRPRVIISDMDWEKSQLNHIFNATGSRWGFQKKALIDSNRHINKILCSATTATKVEFDNSFQLDLPGC